MSDFTEKEFLTASQEKLCDLCFKVAMLYNRRERLIAEGQEKLAVRLDVHIKQLIEDLKQWILKNE